jgi:preprotein translocase subunit SecD
VSLLPVTSEREQACTEAGGRYSMPATADHPALCVQTDRTRGLNDIRVASAKAEKSTVDGTWQVLATLSPADRTRFASLTGSIAGAPYPRNAFAIVIDGKLWGTPYVSASLTGGRFEVVGGYLGDLTSDAAHDLAQQLDPG